MLVLFDFHCDECGHQFEELVERSSAIGPPCPDCGKVTRKLFHTLGTAHRAQIEPAKYRQMFDKARAMVLKTQGRVPWRKSSESQSD